MKMTLREWRFYTQRQTVALWSHLRFYWCNAWGANVSAMKEPLSLMRPSAWIIFARIKTSGYFTMDAHIPRIIARKSMGGTSYSLPSGLTREEKRTKLLELSGAVTREQDEQSYKKAAATFNAICDPRNDHRFSAEAARKAFGEELGKEDTSD